MEGLSIVFIPREKQKSEYDWSDIEYNNSRVGKSRCLINGDEFTIFTITIYPEYQGNGYGSAFVEKAANYSRGGFASKKGDYIMADDFDEPLDDFKEYIQ